MEPRILAAQQQRKFGPVAKVVAGIGICLFIFVVGNVVLTSQGLSWSMLQAESEVQRIVVSPTVQSIAKNQEQQGKQLESLQLAIDKLVNAQQGINQETKTERPTSHNLRKETNELWEIPKLSGAPEVSLELIKNISTPFVNQVNADPKSEHSVKIDFCKMNVECKNGVENIATLSYDGKGIVHFVPHKLSPPPYFLLLSVGHMSLEIASKKEYDTKLAVKLLYGYLHGYEYKLYFMSLPEIVNYSVEKGWVERDEVGNYINEEALYHGHMWYHAWGKPFAMLGEILSNRYHWVMHMDLDAGFEYPKLNVPLTMFVPIDDDPPTTVRDTSTDSFYSFMTGRSTPRDSVDSSWYIRPADYHMIGPSHGDYGKATLQKRFSNFVFISRSSHESEKFYRNWLGHSDCACYADQGAFWIELMRWVVNFNHATKDVLESVKKCENELWGDREALIRGIEAYGKCTEPEYIRENRRCTGIQLYKSTMTCNCLKIRCVEAPWTKVALEKDGNLKPPVALWFRETGSNPKNADRGLRNLITHT